MSEINSLSSSLEHTLKDSDLHNVTISLAEVFVDSLMEEGVAKDIPIIGTVIGLGKTAIGIKESLFLKKIIYFISELRNISAAKRHEIIDKIDKSGKFRTKVGEKLLYIIDRCDDHEKSQIVARLFSAFLLETISYEEFLRASYIVDHLMNDDLKWFIQSGWEKEGSWKDNVHVNYEHGYLKIDEVGKIATSGLVEIVSPEIRVEDQWDRKSGDKYIVEGSELSVRITDIGKKIKEILKDFF
ncbi:MAG: hypothetical protein KKF30_02485 [Proteobacteria bacterium]|nr:hypothetical protein [Pseudomonadota bacterium]MBU4472181.1 hypothetical protein [Pseudomonadota bacterium]MCG2750390.1 hypothetical protein [Desulfobacteraceae bacterium]